VVWDNRKGKMAGLPTRVYGAFGWSIDGNHELDLHHHHQPNLKQCTASSESNPIPTNFCPMNDVPFIEGNAMQT
jgi:hypothetical protein